jgi:hypothetical protein
MISLSNLIFGAFSLSSDYILRSIESTGLSEQDPEKLTLCDPKTTIWV